MAKRQTTAPIPIPQTGPQTTSNVQVGPDRSLLGLTRSSSVGIWADNWLFGTDPVYSRLPTESKLLFPEITPRGGAFQAMSASAAYAIHSLYAEMRLKVPEWFGTLEQRRNKVLSLEWSIVPHTDSPEDADVASFVTKALHKVGGFDGGFNADLSHILDAVQTGLSISEVIWGPGEIDGQPAVLPVDIAHRFPGYFTFNLDQALCYAPRSAELTLQPVDERKFLVSVWGSEFENPYGCGLLQRLMFHYVFKLCVMRYWNLAASKHGSPTPVVKYPAWLDTNKTQESDDSLLAIDQLLSRLQNDTGVRIPDNVSLEFARSDQGMGDAFEKLLNYLDDCAAKTATGATLTSSEGRSGTMALGTVHARIAAEGIAPDVNMTTWTIGRSLIRWIVDLNFGVDVHAPEITFGADFDEDRKGQLAVDKGLWDMGVPLVLTDLYRRYGRPAPEADEQVVVGGGGTGPQAPGDGTDPALMDEFRTQLVRSLAGVSQSTP